MRGAVREERFSLTSKLLTPTSSLSPSLPPFILQQQPQFPTHGDFPCGACSVRDVPRLQSRNLQVDEEERKEGDYYVAAVILALHGEDAEPEKCGRL